MSSGTSTPAPRMAADWGTGHVSSTTSADSDPAGVPWPEGQDTDQPPVVGTTASTWVDWRTSRPTASPAARTTSNAASAISRFTVYYAPAYDEAHARPPARRALERRPPGACFDKLSMTRPRHPGLIVLRRAQRDKTPSP